jgi:hypothetical protein
MGFALYWLLGLNASSYESVVVYQISFSGILILSGLLLSLSSGVPLSGFVQLKKNIETAAAAAAKRVMNLLFIAQ